MSSNTNIERYSFTQASHRTLMSCVLCRHYRCFLYKFVEGKLKILQLGYVTNFFINLPVLKARDFIELYAMGPGYGHGTEFHIIILLHTTPLFPGAIALSASALAALDRKN